LLLDAHVSPHSPLPPSRAHPGDGNDPPVPAGRSSGARGRSTRAARDRLRARTV
jgi:hypothetical protein